MVEVRSVAYVMYNCNNTYFAQIYTRTGGVLEVYPGVNNTVKKGDLIARIKNIFGNVVDEYFAPCAGIVSHLRDD
jgi:predicted deacylase